MNRKIIVNASFAFLSAAFLLSLLTTVYAAIEDVREELQSGSITDTGGGSKEGEKAGDEDRVKKVRKTGTVDVDPGSCLNVRDGVWGNIIDQLPPGEKVKIVGKDGDWFKIDFHGKTAYVYKQFVKTSKNRDSDDKDRPKKHRDEKEGDDENANNEKVTGGNGFEKNGLLDVPERAQCAPENGSLGGTLCGPTSLAMTLEYFGIKKTTLNVALETKSINSSKQFIGTYCENIAAAAKKFLPGSYMKNNLTIDDLKEITASGKPVIVNVNTQGYWPGGHYMVCTGVKNGTVYLNDPGNGSTRTYSSSQFNAQWATRSNRAVVVAP